MSQVLSGTPTDNKGNTFSMIGTAHDYSPLWPNSGEALFQVVLGNGGSDHVFSTVVPPDGDEATFAVVEIKNGGVIQDAQWNKVLNGTPNTSLNVTTTGPATLVAVWAGDGLTVGTNALPNNGFTVVEAQMDGSICGVQGVVATKDVAAAGTYNVTWTPQTPQGAHMWLVAVQSSR